MKIFPVHVAEEENTSRKQKSYCVSGKRCLELAKQLEYEEPRKDSTPDGEVLSMHTTPLKSLNDS